MVSFLIFCVEGKHPGVRLTMIKIILFLFIFFYIRLEKIWKISFPFDLFDTIPDGVLLCKTIKKLRPDLIGEFSESRSAEAALKNVKSLIQACLTLGIKEGPLLFAPEDLVDHNGASLLFSLFFFFLFFFFFFFFFFKQRGFDATR